MFSDDAPTHNQALTHPRDPDRPALVVRGLEKIYGPNIVALRGIDLSVQEGEFITLLGPSGSGKTTLLMLIGGFESPTAGSIFASNTEITTVPPERRNFGVVFQNYALFPHMTVRRNVAYPLAVRNVPRRQREDRVKKAVSLVGLDGMEARRPAQLSGGQQQRVALARALVYEPSILLLDEPLGALDRSLRERMQTELRRLHRETGVTFLYVTHDQDEALTMSDRIVVLNAGRVEQVGTPEELYDRPTTEFVATFVGVANRVKGKVLRVLEGAADLELDSGATLNSPALSETMVPGMRATVVIRPENVRIADDSIRGADEVEIAGILDDIAYGGNLWRYTVRTSGGSISGQSTHPLGIPLGDRLRLRWRASDGWAIPHEAPGHNSPNGTPT